MIVLLPHSNLTVLIRISRLTVTETSLPLIDFMAVMRIINKLSHSVLEIFHHSGIKTRRVSGIKRHHCETVFIVVWRKNANFPDRLRSR